MPKPIRETRVLKLVFITIPCLKLWALDMYVMYCITSTAQPTVPNQILPPTGQSEGLSLPK